MTILISLKVMIDHCIKKKKTLLVELKEIDITKILYYGQKRSLFTMIYLTKS